MAITIMVGDDRNLTESEVDQYTETLAEFVDDRLGEILESTDLDPYLIEVMSSARVIQPDRARPEQPDNIELLEEVEARGQSCSICSRHAELLRFLTCVGTHDAYYAFRELMEIHDYSFCWSTTFPDSEDTPANNNQP